MYLEEVLTKSDLHNQRTAKLTKCERERPTNMVNFFKQKLEKKKETPQNVFFYCAIKDPKIVGL